MRQEGRHPHVRPATSALGDSTKRGSGNRPPFPLVLVVGGRLDRSRMSSGPTAVSLRDCARRTFLGATRSGAWIAGCIWVTLAPYWTSPRSAMKAWSQQSAWPTVTSHALKAFPAELCSCSSSLGHRGLSSGSLTDTSTNLGSSRDPDRPLASARHRAVVADPDRSARVAAADSGHVHHSRLPVGRDRARRRQCRRRGWGASAN